MTISTDEQTPRLEDIRTWREAVTSREAIDAAVAALDGPEGEAAADLLRGAQRVVVTGAGSSYYLAQVVASVARAVTRRPALAVPLSELLLRPATVLGEEPADEAVIVVSRSGSTSEAVAVADAMRASGHPTIALTCRPASPLAALADVTLVSPEGDEAAVVMTRSFASMLALLLRLVARVGEEAAIAEDLRRSTAAWSKVTDAAGIGRRLGGTDWSRIVILGGGPAFGLAAEWGLKLLETSQVPTSAYEPLEFRHGPISVCEPGVLVVGLIGGVGAADEIRVFDEAAALGASTWLLTGD